MASQLRFYDNTDQPEILARFVDVIIPLAVPNTYTYRVPAAQGEQVMPGMRVAVQFGKKKVYTGIVYKVHTDPPKDYTAKYILDLLDSKPIVGEMQLRFWKWISEYYCCCIGEVMDAALPNHMKLTSETTVSLNPAYMEQPYDWSDKERIVVMALEARGALTISEISEVLDQKTVLPIIKTMYEKNLIQLKEEVQEMYKARREIFVEHLFDPDNRDAIELLFRQLEPAPRQSDLLMAYLQLNLLGKPVMRKELLKAARTSASPLDSLVEKGIFRLYEDEVDRVKDKDGNGWTHTLNAEQSKAAEEIIQEFQSKDVVLLHGITGSGKTHVYMDLIDAALAEGRQALYLVPEIALTAQLIQRLRSKYGKEIGIYHSKFSNDERVEIWHKVLNGTYKVVLGVRSALFLPFADLGLLVIDEEHEMSYKQHEPSPRYHARDAGIYLMYMYGGKTILGSATPGFETYFNAQRGKYGLVKLESRWGGIKMPEMLLSDLRDEHRKKTMKNHFSGQLFSEMQKTLQETGQIILFQNRRGYAPLLECTTCGWTPMCQNCDISLTYHQSSRDIICHYCSYKEDSPKKCTACGNYTLKMLGFGTEKIEDELGVFFPDYKSLRMDQDTTRGKQAFNRIITALEDGDAQILVGTQMVTKGLDFENVRLVGILNADQMLRYPDFRAVERSYQLMSQVSGRAGRRDKQGKVVIQTFNVQHPVFRYLLAHDYENFYADHIQERLDFKYPPFYKLIQLMVRDEKQERVTQSAEWLAARLRELFGARVLGPEFPPIARIRGRYTMNIMLKFERQNLNMQAAKKVLMTEVEAFRTNKDFKGIRLLVDVDP